MLRALLAKRLRTKRADVVAKFDWFNERIDFRFDCSKGSFEGWLIAVMSRVAIKAEYGYEVVISPQGDECDPLMRSTITRKYGINMEGLSPYALAKHASVAITYCMGLSLAEIMMSDDLSSIYMNADHEDGNDAQPLFNEFGVSQHRLLPNRPV